MEWASAHCSSWFIDWEGIWRYRFKWIPPIRLLSWRGAWTFRTFSKTRDHDSLRRSWFNGICARIMLVFTSSMDDLVALVCLSYIWTHFSIGYGDSQSPRTTEESIFPRYYSYRKVAISDTAYLCRRRIALISRFLEPRNATLRACPQILQPTISSIRVKTYYLKRCYHQLFANHAPGKACIMAHINLI